MHIKNTLFIGKVFHHFPSLGSTNQYAHELLAKSRPIEGTVISTDHQTAGRGQIGSSWKSEAEQNIAVSIILYPDFLPARSQFLLTQAVSLGVRAAIVPHLSEGVSVKWPNDVYAGTRKLAGILIQNAISGSRIQYSVVGIGLNVNQASFSAELPNPTSLALETAQTYDLETLTADLCLSIEQRYLQLKRGDHESLRRDYLQRLYRYGQPAHFRIPDGPAFRGVISGVAESGHLLVEYDGRVAAFALKEIQFV